MEVVAELITIGDELLIGQVVDTNSAWIGKSLNKIGVTVRAVTSVRDVEADILEAIELARSRADIVLMTGGLGPTKDDITKVALCRYFKTKLVFNQAVYQNIKQLLGESRPINELNKGQAYVPEGCCTIQNRVGSAPISWFDCAENRVVVSMPGVPFEMKWVMENEILPRLKKQFKTASIIHRTFYVKNYPESTLAELLAPWEERLPKALKLAYLPQLGLMRLRLTAQNGTESELEELLDKAEEGLSSLLKEDLFLANEASLEELLGQLLIDKGLTVSTAESCTGGAIAARIARIAGASSYFIGGVVSYSNEVKIDQLGVNPATLDKFGAVSEETALEMVKGVCRELKTTCGVATTGIAGPTGGSAIKPVGTVWIAVKCGDLVMTKKVVRDQGRTVNIERASNYALLMLIEQIKLLD